MGRVINKLLYQQKNLNDLLKDEAVRVELASRAGGMITRNLVKQGEELIKQYTYSGMK